MPLPQASEAEQVFKPKTLEQINEKKAYIHHLEKQAENLLTMLSTTNTQAAMARAELDHLYADLNKAQAAQDGLYEGAEFIQYKMHVIEKGLKSATAEPLLTSRGSELLRDFVKHWKAAERWNAATEKAMEERKAWLVGFFLEKFGEMSVVNDLFVSESAKRRRLA